MKKNVWICENGAKGLISRTKRAFFPRQRGDIKIKRKISPFFGFFYPFIVISLPSCLYFLVVFMAWRRPKGLEKSR